MLAPCLFSLSTARFCSHSSITAHFPPLYGRKRSSSTPRRSCFFALVFPSVFPSCSAPCRVFSSSSSFSTCSRLSVHVHRPGYGLVGYSTNTTRYKILDPPTSSTDHSGCSSSSTDVTICHTRNSNHHYAGYCSFACSWTARIARRSPTLASVSHRR